MKLFPSRPRLPAKHAFTLLEVLAAIALTVIMLAFVQKVTINILKLWNGSIGALTAENQASLVMDVMTQDIRGAVMKRDGGGWFVATVQGNQNGPGDTLNQLPGASWTSTYSNGVVKPTNEQPGGAGSSLSLFPSISGLEQVPGNGGNYVVPSSAADSANQFSANRVPDLRLCRFGQAGVFLRFFSKVPDLNGDLKNNDNEIKNTSGVLRAVSYQLVRMKPTFSSEDYRYQFYRSSVRPFIGTEGAGNSNAATNSTFGIGYDLLGNTEYYNKNGGNAVNLNDAGNIRQPNIQQLLANNVIDFGLRVWGRALDPTGTGKYMDVLLFPVSNTNLGFAITSADGTSTLYNNTTYFGNNHVTAPMLANQSVIGVGNKRTLEKLPAGWTSNSMTYGYTVSQSGQVLRVTPAYVDIFLRILDDVGVQRIDLIEKGLLVAPVSDQLTPQMFWWQTAIAHSRVFIRRVEFMSVPL